MNSNHPNYLLMICSQVGAHSYGALERWLIQREYREVGTSGVTAHAVLVYWQGTQNELEVKLKEMLGQWDRFQVVQVHDFDQDVIPDDENALQRWLEARSDWQEWCARHE